MHTTKEDSELRAIKASARFWNSIAAFLFIIVAASSIGTFFICFLATEELTGKLIFFVIFLLYYMTGCFFTNASLNLEGDNNLSTFNTVSLCAILGLLGGLIALIFWIMDAIEILRNNEVETKELLASFWRPCNY